MTHLTVSKSADPATRRAERMQDFLLVSSFGLWATLLGLAPVMLFSLVRGS